MNELILPGQVTETSLELPQTLSLEEWRGVGGVLGRIGKAVQWWIGDWLRYGEHKYGETYAREAELTGYDKQYLKQMKWVSQKIETVDRSTVLSWRHHCEIAALPKAEHRTLLAEAEKEAWSVSRLRAAVKLHNAGPALAIPPGRFRVLYADPPWDYANTGFAQSAASQYPTMPLDAIQELPVGDLSTDDGVIFLWATAPLLPEADLYRIVRAIANCEDDRYPRSEGYRGAAMVTDFLRDAVDGVPWLRLVVKYKLDNGRGMDVSEQKLEVTVEDMEFEDRDGRFDDQLRFQ